jgi:hypothetical protein
MFEELVLALVIFIGVSVGLQLAGAVAQMARGQRPEHLVRSIRNNLCLLGIGGYFALFVVIYQVSQDRADKGRPNYEAISTARLQMLRLMALGATSVNSPAREQYLRAKKLLAELRRASRLLEVADELEAIKTITDQLERERDDDRAVAETRATAYREQDI